MSGITLSAHLPPPLKFEISGGKVSKTFHFRHFTVADHDFLVELATVQAGKNPFASAAGVMAVGLHQLEKDEVADFCALFAADTPDGDAPLDYIRCALAISRIAPLAIYGELNKTLVGAHMRALGDLSTDGEANGGEKKRILLGGLMTATLLLSAACLGGIIGTFSTFTFLTS